jgi:hypothetical protein
MVGDTVAGMAREGSTEVSDRALCAPSATPAVEFLFSGECFSPKKSAACRNCQRHETFFVERASVVLRDGATHAGRTPAHWRRAGCPMHPADAIGPHCWRLARLSAPAKGFPRRLTLRRDHLLLGEAQNGGAIALAGRPGSLEAIDRRARVSQR